MNPAIKELLSKTEEIVITQRGARPQQQKNIQTVSLQERLDGLQQWQAKGMQPDRPSLSALQSIPIDLKQAHGLFIGSISQPKYPSAKPFPRGSMSALASTALALVTDRVEPKIRATVPCKPARLLTSTPALPIVPKLARDMPEGHFFKTFTPEHGDLHCALFAYPRETGTESDGSLTLHFLEVDLTRSVRLGPTEAAAVHVRTCRCVLRSEEDEDDGQPALRLMDAGYLPAEDQLFLHLQQGVRDRDSDTSMTGSRPVVDFVGILRFPQEQIPCADLMSMTTRADGEEHKIAVQYVKPLQIARRARPVLQTDLSVSRNTLGVVSGNEGEKRLVVLMTVVLL